MNRLFESDVTPGYFKHCLLVTPSEGKGGSSSAAPCRKGGCWHMLCQSALECCRCMAGTGLGSGIVQAGTLQGEMNGITQNRIQDINQMC